MNNFIQELLSQQLITEDQAKNIQIYLDNKPKADSFGRALTIFAVLGAALVGLGIILIVAHNWDNLSRPIKIFLAFLPTVLGQAFCFFTIFKKKDQAAWRESTATFLIFSVGATISLIAQIFNISGDMASFLLTWILLSLPLVYILPSSMAALLSLLGITMFAYSSFYSSDVFVQKWMYWPLFAALLPHYWSLMQQENLSGIRSNFLNFLHVALPLSLIFCIPAFFGNGFLYIPIAYVLLGAVFMVYGKKWAKIYPILGAVGTIFCLFGLSYTEIWEEFFRKDFQINTVAAIILLAMFGLLIWGFMKKTPVYSLNRPLEWAFLALPVGMAGSMASPVFSAVLINILLIAMGVFYLRQGLANADLQRMNLGLLTLIILIALRFFDLDISYAFRGILFVLMGIAFFAANYFMIKGRKNQN